MIHLLSSLWYNLLSNCSKGNFSESFAKVVKLWLNFTPSKSFSQPCRQMNYISILMFLHQSHWHPWHLYNPTQSDHCFVDIGIVGKRIAYMARCNNFPTSPHPNMLWFYATGTAGSQYDLTKKRTIGSRFKLQCTWSLNWLSNLLWYWCHSCYQWSSFSLSISHEFINSLRVASTFSNDMILKFFIQ